METHPIWHDYPELNSRLVMMKQVIDKNIRIKDKEIKAIINEVMNAGGKLLRPAYMFLCSEIGPNYDEDKAIGLAAAIEILHIATLVHDDVIDQSDTRRGKSTLNYLHDNKFAIYAGDYLFSVCFTILSKHSSSLSHLSYNATSMRKILSGEMDQLHSRFQSPDSVKSYLSRISGKTAQLFALSCYVGAVESGATKKEFRTAYNMGHYIGMAFQIIDDILDFQGDQEAMGKPVMADVQQGIYTLPVVYAMRRRPIEMTNILNKERPLSSQNLNELTRIINETKAIQQAQNLAERYTTKALQQLDKLPDGNYKDTLYQLTNQLLKRTT